MSHISHLVHFVWSTKERRNWMHQSWQPRMFDYIGGILRNKRAVLRCAGGMPDHVHLYVSLPSTISLATTVNVVKSNSSKWIHDEIGGMDKFAWQEGYAAFSVSKSGEDKLKRYIENQQEHHRTQSFQEEYVAFLEKHDVEYDPRYLWE